MAGVANLFNGHLLNKSNEEVNLNDEKYKGTVIGLYFSAHWCPPCRAFTPKLIEFYQSYAQEKKLEIIFVSSDQDEQSFEEYYHHMPWLKLDFGEKDKKEELDKKFGINGIPKLILLDGDHATILCNDARDQIQTRDKHGKHFPWNYQQPKLQSKCILF